MANTAQRFFNYEGTATMAGASAGVSNEDNIVKVKCKLNFRSEYLSNLRGEIFVRKIAYYWFVLEIF